MESERYFAGDITIVLADGSRVPAKVTADEIYVEGKEIYRISFEQGTEARTAESGEDFFEALKQLRLDLENRRTALLLRRQRECLSLWNAEIDGTGRLGLQDAYWLPSFTPGHCQHL